MWSEDNQRDAASVIPSHDHSGREGLSEGINNRGVIPAVRLNTAFCARPKRPFMGELGGMSGNDMQSAPTLFLLMAQYCGRTVGPLDDVCRDFFGHLTRQKLLRKVLRGEIAIPIVRIEKSKPMARNARRQASCTTSSEFTVGLQRIAEQTSIGGDCQYPDISLLQQNLPRPDMAPSARSENSVANWSGP